jgi:AraC-like DNA-binding protein
MTLSSVFTVMLRSYFDSLDDMPRHAGQFHNLPADGYLERRVSLEETRVLLDQIAARVGHYGFGLDVGARIHPSDFGLLGYLLMNCPNLLQACQTAVRYKNLINEGLSGFVCSEGDRVFYVVENRHELAFLAPMIELDLAAALMFARLLAGVHQQDRIRFLSVEFAHEPLQAVARYEAFFGCPVYFGCAHNTIEMHRSFTDCAVYGASPRLFAQFDARLRDREHQRRVKQPLSMRVSDFLASQLGQDVPDLVRVAEHFHMSVSALKKHLQQEGTSFLQIYDEVRRREACRLFEDGRMAQKEIAFRLGFTSHSAFIRAFRRWQNMSPSEYRRQEPRKTHG